MASNYFGNLFRFTSWGESHGSAVGVVIDGFPAGVEIDLSLIQAALDSRKPGFDAYSSPRKEQDELIVLSGISYQQSTGAPLSFMVKNKNVDSSSYKASLSCYRPGHADYTYHKKYKNYHQAGGGRASARETIARVIAGAVADCVLEKLGVKTYCYINALGNINAKVDEAGIDWEYFYNSRLGWHPEKEVVDKMKGLIQKLVKSGDSVGGAVSFIVTGCPLGLGEPIYDKLPARLAYSLMSLPASKAFGYGSGFSAKSSFGSQHNDQMYGQNNVAKFSTNNAGGILGGISSGEIINGEVVFKPISSIKKSQQTINHENNTVDYIQANNARHDPTAVVRAMPVVKAMVQCVLLDMFLLNNAFDIQSILSKNND